MIMAGVKLQGREHSVLPLNKTGGGRASLFTLLAVSSARALKKNPGLPF